MRLFFVACFFAIAFLPFALNAAQDLDHLTRNPANWAHQRGQYNNQGYSALNQINTRNVKNLNLAWTFATGIHRGHEGSPLVIGNLMYIHTAFPNNIYALDLQNDQKIVWSYFPKQDLRVQVRMCCDTVNRGLSYGNGKIILQQNDGLLVALDSKSGKVIWQTQVNDPNTGATNTNAPMVVKDKVLTGCAGGEYGVRCFIAAYSLDEGTLIWKAYSTGSDADVLIGNSFNSNTPHYSALSVYKDINGGNKKLGSFEPLPEDQLAVNEPDLGMRTWLKPQQEQDGWQNGGGGVTGYFAYDRKTNLIYYGTGNPGVWNPDIRPGDNKWSSSVFARDMDTGMARWAMQTTPHDEWDYDATGEVILFDNKGQTYASQVNQNGFIYTWLATKGTLHVAVKLHPFVNWASDVNLKTGVPAKDARYNTHQDYNAKGICPTDVGAKGMNPAAYSPRTGLIYTPLYHMCMTYEPIESKYVSGQPWVGTTTTRYAGPDGGYGSFAAYDPLTGKNIWYNKEKYATTGGVLATAGDLVFYGTGERWFKALHAKTGKTLWQFQLGNSIVGNPFSYQLRGKQYVGILSGIGGGLIPSHPYLGKSKEHVHVACTPGGYGGPIESYRQYIPFDMCGSITTKIMGAGELNIFNLSPLNQLKEINPNDHRA